VLNCLRGDIWTARSRSTQQRHRMSATKSRELMHWRFPRLSSSQLYTGVSKTSPRHLKIEIRTDYQAVDGAITRSKASSPSWCASLRRLLLCESAGFTQHANLNVMQYTSASPIEATSDINTSTSPFSPSTYRTEQMLLASGQQGRRHLSSISRHPLCTYPRAHIHTPGDC
jgi:hypothetical protein